MRPHLVIILLPGGQHGARLGQRGEQCLVQAFIPQPTVEAFHESILLRLAGCDVVPLDAPVLGPLQDRHARQLGAVVADDHQRLASAGDEPIQFSRDPPARE